MKGEVELIFGNEVIRKSNLLFFKGRDFLLKTLLFGNPRQTVWYAQVGRRWDTVSPDTELSSLLEPITEKRIYFPDEFWNPDVSLDLDNARVIIRKSFEFDQNEYVGEVGIVIQRGDQRILLNRATFYPPKFMPEGSNLSVRFILTFL